MTIQGVLKDQEPEKSDTKEIQLPKKKPEAKDLVVTAQAVAEHNKCSYEKALAAIMKHWPDLYQKYLDSLVGRKE